MQTTHVDTLDEERLLDDLKDIESRRLFYAEHISTGLPIQIRELRKKRNLTQKKLGEGTGMDQSTISDIENPNYEYTPQIGTLKRLADAFDVPLIVRFGSWGDLLEWETELSPEAVAPPKFEDDEKIKRAVARIAAASTDATGSQPSGNVRTVNLTLPSRTVNLTLPSLTDALAHSDSVEPVEEIGTGKLLDFQASKERLEAERGRRTGSPSRNESQTRLGKMPSTQAKANKMRAGRQ